jgi:outer membrane protein OmpA-like peptidoglycan-associated protein
MVRVFALLIALLAAGHADALEAERVPFVAGLTTVRATSEARGDYETLRVVDEITAAGYRITASGEVPADDGSGLREVTIIRRVRAQDQSTARRIRTFFHSADVQQFSGTVPGFSAALVNDLRVHGKARLTYLDVGEVFGVSAVRRELSGSIERVKGGTSSIPMLVNGKRVPLAVLHAKGRLSDGRNSEEFEFHVLDDPDNPILLRSRGAGTSSSLVRIEYPLPKASARTIEGELAAERSAEIHGIYFSFASDVIRPQSERVLAEIAAALKGNPGWRLRIDGHTDGVGADAANLDLSRRRAAAVKKALVGRHGIAAARLTTGGHGESQPKADNATVEGRARNRRVELIRL